MSWGSGVVMVVLTALLTSCVCAWIWRKRIRRELEEVRRYQLLLLRAVVQAELAEWRDGAAEQPRGRVIQLRAAVPATSVPGKPASIVCSTTKETP